MGIIESKEEKKIERESEIWRWKKEKKFTTTISRYVCNDNRCRIIDNGIKTVRSTIRSSN